MFPLLLLLITHLRSLVLSADVVQVSQKSNPREMLCIKGPGSEFPHTDSSLYLGFIRLGEKTLFPRSLLCSFSPEEDLLIPQVSTSV